MAALKKHKPSKVKKDSAKIAFNLIGRRDALLKSMRLNCDKLGGPQVKPKDRSLIGEYVFVAANPGFGVIDLGAANKAIKKGMDEMKKFLKSAGSKDREYKLPPKPITVKDILKWRK